ncbi:hypothetical protein M8C21_033328 [Ambrosia artemisiifolia]|uniref:Uncharacterized protein n=1 Tax=Ambrosia artemisiifolia TaxID=4212 RepID=A0AAD5CSQ6_AMBAR|nr:hypothetical protein M8C21_033328 [Ambrosia artemisiifolia]
MVFNNSAFRAEDDDDLPCVVDCRKKEVRGCLNTCEEDEFGTSSCLSSYLNEKQITSSSLRRQEVSFLVRFFGSVLCFSSDMLGKETWDSHICTGDLG